MHERIMRTKSIILLLILLVGGAAGRMFAQGVDVSGKVIAKADGQPIEFASVMLKDHNLWAISDMDGYFTIKNVPQGKTNLVVQCLGYVQNTITLDVLPGMKPLKVIMASDNLGLDQVEVVAHRKTDVATTSYAIDRMVLDNQQILNLSDIQSLLPGGKTVNSTLMNDPRIILRAGSAEKGNASFGTAIEVDGARLGNNMETGETMAASTRTLSASSIESVEVVTGVASVEHGDLSNGVVRIHTRQGKSPFIVEGKINQHTHQVAVNKGLDLGKKGGILNVSAEHAQSFSDIASPHTAYQRNIFSARYMKVFMPGQMPLTLNAGISANIGGYNSEADPDRDLDDYVKQRDNNFRGNIEVRWLLNKPWLTNLTLKGSVSYADKKTEDYYNTSSATTQPYIHTMQNGYFIAEEHSVNPNANILLSPTGYWYVTRYNDSKPFNYTALLKADLTRRFGTVLNSILVGAELTGGHNLGRGTYYGERSYAPTWREYRYDKLPSMNNLALYAEEKIVVPTTERASLEVTAGLRDDITFVGGSDYGTISSLSPRVNSRYVFWRGSKAWVSDLAVHAGWGKSVKLPSFQVLYPTPSYSDHLAFTPGSTADNKSFYAYHTYVSRAIYNRDLRWQYTHQTDVGFEMTILGTRVNVSVFRHKTHNPYMATSLYTPFAYLMTGQAALEKCPIPSADRIYTIDRENGVVTVTDQTGANTPVVLSGNERHTFLSNSQYVNASPIERYGLEWIVDFRQIRALRTSIRIDGNYYHYKGIDETFFADVPVSLGTTMTNGQMYGYIGYYRGSNATSTGYTANASVANGAINSQLNTNVTLSTHIPQLRMIVAMRIESTLMHHSRPVSRLSDGTRGIMLENASDYFGDPYDGASRDQYIAVYPDYYSTWENPGELIPFAEKFLWARDNDKSLYSDLTRLVVKTNYAYTMNPDHISAYYSANLSVTKEIGDHVSVSFYANNFFNNMGKVHSSRTGLDTSLFTSGYIPKFYYGLSLRLKI